MRETTRKNKGNSKQKPATNSTHSDISPQLYGGFVQLLVRSLPPLRVRPLWWNKLTFTFTRLPPNPSTCVLTADSIYFQTKSQSILINMHYFSWEPPVTPCRKKTLGHRGGVRLHSLLLTCFFFFFFYFFYFHLKHKY